MMKKLGLHGFAEIMQNRVLDEQENPTAPQIWQSRNKILDVEFSKKRGLQEFIIEGVKYYAINQQAAVKKRTIELGNFIVER